MYMLIHLGLQPSEIGGMIWPRFLAYRAMAHAIQRSIEKSNKPRGFEAVTNNPLTDLDRQHDTIADAIKAGKEKYKVTG